MEASFTNTSCAAPLTSHQELRRTCVKIGATYEGRDPRLLERILPLVDYLEVTLETIAEMRDGQVRLSDEVMTELKNAACSVRFVIHGVGLSIGSHDGCNEDYFCLLDQFLENIDVVWHSEHLAYTKVDGQHLGIMLALPKTKEVLDLISHRVTAIQQRYDLPFLLENVVHVLPDYPGDYSDAEFMNALADRTGVGLILDVYNLECDAYNQGFDIPGFLSVLDHARVREIHVACGVEHNGFLLDVHSQRVRPSTLQLAKQAIETPDSAVEVVVYEFMPEAVPGLGYDAIEAELRQLHRLLQG